MTMAVGCLVVLSLLNAHALAQPLTPHENQLSNVSVDFWSIVFLLVLTFDYTFLIRNLGLELPL